MRLHVPLQSHAPRAIEFLVNVVQMQLGRALTDEKLRGNFLRPWPCPRPGNTHNPTQAPEFLCTIQPMMTPEKPTQPRNPLHGLTLEAIVTQLADHFGWDELGRLIPVRCFTHEPSVGSSLKFLRKTPWARDKVESLYLFMLRSQKRQALGQDDSVR